MPLELGRFHLTFVCGCRMVTTRNSLTLVATGGSPVCLDHHRAYLSRSR